MVQFSMFTFGYHLRWSPDKLAPFAMWLVFPPADYYGASDATTGLGRLLFQSVGNRDLIVVQDLVMLLTAVVLVVNFQVFQYRKWKA